MEFVDAWTVLLSENAPPPKESNARFHPLLHAAKAKLESLPEEAAYALGISGISIDINYLNGIRRSHSRVFSGDIGEDLVFGFSGSQLLSYVERYRGRKVVKNQHEIITPFCFVHDMRCHERRLTGILELI